METPPGRVHPDLPPPAYRDMTRILRVGLLISLAILSGGVIAFLVLTPSESFQELAASNPIVTYLNLYSLLSGIASGQVEAYLTLGVLVLLATPIARVATGCFFFYRNGEREIAAVTLLVAILLIVGLLVIGPLVR
jgi:uncharacterized membrane protein